MIRKGFDNDKYIRIQSEKIKERIANFGGKLYVEFGGKLFDDYHASRVLPGFEPDTKMRMLREFGNDIEIIVTICANDIEKHRRRGDLGITYDEDVLRLMDIYTGAGFKICGVVVTQYANQRNADKFIAKLREMGVPVYLHYPIEGYPENVEKIVSEEGYGKNEYVKTSKSLIIVTGPGPGSGKLATCLSQLYADYTRGVKSGYAKFETFPVWNLPLDHEVNYAYESATADLNDINEIDYYHRDAYGVEAVNYNRDLEAFPVLKAMFELIWGECPYKSPTDMGVNMIGYCISDDEACREAARREILRRWFIAQVDYKKMNIEKCVLDKAESIVEKAHVTIAENPAITAARIKEKTTGAPAAAMELPDGRVISGRTSSLMGAAAALLLNALKVLGNIPKETKLMSPNVLRPITDMKVNSLGHHNARLHSDEVLIALCVSAVTNEAAELAQNQLGNLKGSEAFFTVIPSEVDVKLFKRLGINICSEPMYESLKLYHK